MGMEVEMQSTDDYVDKQTLSDLHDTIDMIRGHNKGLEEAVSLRDSELHQLRKELAKVEDEKAKQELDFMNQLASLPAGSDEGSKKLNELEQENATLKESSKNANLLRDAVQQLESQLDEFRKVHISETGKLKKDFNWRLNDLHTQKDNLQVEKTALLEEMSELKVQLNEKSESVESLQKEAQEVEQKHLAKIAQLEEAKQARENALDKHQLELGEMNDTLIEMETHQASLLDEVSKYRKQLERQSKKTQNLQVQLSTSTSEDVETLEERAKSAEAEMENLKAKLIETEESYKMEVAKLSETVVRREEELLDKQNEIMMVRKTVEEEEEKTAELSSEIKRVKEQLGIETMLAAERKIEIEDLMSQREAFEKRSTENLGDLVAEADSLREQNEILYKEVDTLVEKLNKEKEAVEKLKLENKELMSETGPRSLPVARAVAISSDRSQNASEDDDSSRRSSVKGMVACFEQGSSPIQKRTNETNQLQIMQDKVNNQTKLIGELQAEIVLLSATKNKSQQETDEIVALQSQLQQVAGDLNSERRLVEELKAELEELKSAKPEQKPWENEREAQMLGLRAALTKEQENKSDLENSYTEKVKSLEESIEILQREAEEEIAAKEKEIAEVQVALYRKEDAVAKLKKDVRRLQLSVTEMSGSKNEQLEELELLQEELMEKTRAASKMSRQLQSLESRLEEETEETQKELVYWKSKVKELEADKNRRSSMVHLSENVVQKVKDENVKLRESVKKLSTERQGLQEKLKSIKSDTPDQKSPHYVQRLKEKNQILKKEVDRLQRRCKNIGEPEGSRVEI